MYSQYTSEYVEAEVAYRTEQVRRGRRPSRRRARALYEAETRDLRKRS